MRDQLESLIMQMYKSNILYSEAVREFKKKFILTVLQENKGNQCRAARELGMRAMVASDIRDHLGAAICSLDPDGEKPL